MSTTAVWRSLFVALAVALPAASATAQLDPPVPRVRFERIDSRDGLSNNTVTALLQDHRGFLWVGTADGLNRYDGYEFVVYRADRDDSTTLSSSDVTALYEDENGIWVGTSSGLNLFDPVKETAVRFGSPLRIVSLHPAADSSFWIVTGSRFIRYHPWQNLAETVLSISSPPASAMRETADEQVSAPSFVITSEGGSKDADAPVTARIISYSPADDALVEVWRGERNGTVLGFPSKGGEVWLGAASPGYVDLATRRYHPIDDWPADLATNYIYAGSGGVVWLMTDRGMYRYDRAGGGLSRHTLESGSTAGLSARALSMIEDRTGILWVGTRSGLYKHDPNAQAFVSFAPGGGLPDAPGAGTVMSIAQSLAGDILVGTFGAGLYRLDGFGSAENDALPTPQPVQLDAETVWALEFDARGGLWAGTTAGLRFRSPGSSEFVPVDLPRALPRVALPTVFDIASAQDGTLWVAGHQEIYNVESSSGSVIRSVMIYRPEDSDVRDNFVSCQVVVPAADGTVWVGTEGAGLIRVDPRTGDVRPLRWHGAASHGLDGSTVHDVVFADAGAEPVLWLATDRGLARYDVRGSSFSLEIGNVVVFSILGSDDGVLWLGTSRGLIRRAADGSVQEFDELDGTGNTEYNRRAALALQSGDYVFGGLDGLTVLAPNEIRRNPHAPPVEIIRVTTADRDGAIVRNGVGLEKLRINYTDYRLSIDFAALGFTATDRNTYSYMLEGFDERWVEAGNTRTVDYTNLDPGTYSFRVRAKNNDGVDDGSGDQLIITILPLFYQTWWFVVAMIFLGVGALYSAYRYRVGRLLAVERMRLSIAADLHDDVGSRLSGLALLSDVVGSRPGLDGADRTRLERISVGARELVDTLRDIVWFVHPENEDSRDLIGRMRESASELLPDTQVDFRSSDEQAFVGMDIRARRNVFLIYKEAITNIARHADAGRVDIQIAAAGGVFLAVSDDGAGFDVDGRGRGDGLRNMKYRAEQIGGSLRVVSAPGRGTTIRLALNNANA